MWVFLCLFLDQGCTFRCIFIYMFLFYLTLSIAAFSNIEINDIKMNNLWNIIQC